MINKKKKSILLKNGNLIIITFLLFIIIIMLICIVNYISSLHNHLLITENKIQYIQSNTNNIINYAKDTSNSIMFCQYAQNINFDCPIRDQIDNNDIIDRNILENNEIINIRNIMFISAGNCGEFELYNLISFLLSCRDLEKIYFNRIPKISFFEKLELFRNGYEKTIENRRKILNINHIYDHPLIENNRYIDFSNEFHLWYDIILEYYKSNTIHRQRQYNPKKTLLIIELKRYIPYVINSFLINGIIPNKFLGPLNNLDNFEYITLPSPPEELDIPDDIIRIIWYIIDREMKLNTFKSIAIDYDNLDLIELRVESLSNKRNMERLFNSIGVSIDDSFIQLHMDYIFENTEREQYLSISNNIDIKKEQLYIKYVIDFYKSYENTYSINLDIIASIISPENIL